MSYIWWLVQFYLFSFSFAFVEQDGQRLSSSPYIESSRYREETENRRLRAVMSACPRIVEGYRAPSPRSIVSMRAFSGQSSTHQTSPYSDRKSSSESPHIASHDENFPHSAKQLQSSSSQLSPTSSLYQSELQSESASNRGLYFDCRIFFFFGLVVIGVFSFFILNPVPHLYIFTVYFRRAFFCSVVNFLN